MILVRYVNSVLNFIGVSLRKPHCHDNEPHVYNNGMSVSFTPRLSHPGSGDSCACILKYSMYSGILTWLTCMHGEQLSR